MGLFSSSSKSKNWLQGWQPAMDQIKGELMPLLGRGLSQDWTGYQGDLTAGFSPWQQQGMEQLANWGGYGQASDALTQAGLGGLGAFGDSASLLRQIAGRGPAQNLGPDMNRVSQTVSALEPTRAAMLRDPYRGLTEQTLPGLDVGMNAGGMLNSTSNAVQQAIAKRGFADRAADVDASLMNTALGMEQARAAQNAGLAQQGFGDQLQAARSLGNLGTASGNLLTSGVGMGQQGIENLLRAGGMQQGQSQREIDAAMRQHYMDQQLPLLQAQGFAPLLSGLAAQFGVNKGKTKNSTSPLSVGTSLLGGAMMGGMNPFGFLGGMFGGGNTYQPGWGGAPYLNAPAYQPGIVGLWDGDI